MTADAAAREMLRDTREAINSLTSALSVIPEEILTAGEVATADETFPAYSADLMLARRDALLEEMPGLIARAHATARLLPCKVYGLRCAHPACLAEIDLGETFLRLVTVGYEPQKFHIECAQIILGRDLAEIGVTR